MPVISLRNQSSIASHRSLERLTRSYEPFHRECFYVTGTLYWYCYSQRSEVVYRQETVTAGHILLQAVYEPAVSQDLFHGCSFWTLLLHYRVTLLWVHCLSPIKRSIRHSSFHSFTAWAVTVKPRNIPAVTLQELLGFISLSYGLFSNIPLTFDSFSFLYVTGNVMVMLQQVFG